MAFGNDTYTTADNQIILGRPTITETVLQAHVIAESKAAFETSGAHTPAFSINDSTGSPFLEITAQTQALGNLGIGTDCLNGITTGTFNFCFGRNAGLAIADGDSNILIGNASNRF